MNDAASKPIRSPSYPSMSLRDAVTAVSKIEGQYRSSAVDRTVAAKLIGYSGLSGPANKALAALASYGLLERAGKGETRVTERARDILHAQNNEQRKEKLREAALEPLLFREIRERFDDIDVPPEDGVVTYLHRQGFNPSAVRPAAKAFLQTMNYLQELGATESHGPESGSTRKSGLSGGSAVTYGGARVGDLVQWESQGVLQFPEPLRVRLVTDDGEWIAVDGSETGIPMNEVIVEKRTAETREKTPPKFSLTPTGEGVKEEGEVEWMRNTLNPDTRVRILVNGDMGAKEIGKLIRLLKAQRAVLMDEDDEETGTA